MTSSLMENGVNAKCKFVQNVFFFHQGFTCKPFLTLYTEQFSGIIPLQHNRLVESPLWMDGKMPSIGLVRLCEHRALVYGSITGYLVDWKVVPCLELLSHMYRKTLPGFLVVRLFGDVWSPLGIVEQFTTRRNGVLPEEYQAYRGRVWKNLF